MSDIFQEFVKRRSIRRYTEEPIADDLLRRILAVGLMSASGKSKSPWQFIVVRDRAMLEKAGVAAVMANGMPHIQALADLVSRNDCVHDGVAELFERLKI